MIRIANKEDRAFVANSWLSSFESSNWSGLLTNQVYWNVYQPLVDALLDSSTVSVFVFCNPKDPEQIFGYVVVEKPANNKRVLHYLYVKAPFRNTKQDQPNIALKLLAHVSMTQGTKFEFTFRTPAWDKFHRYHSLNAKHQTGYIRRTQTTNDNESKTSKTA